MLLLTLIIIIFTIGLLISYNKGYLSLFIIFIILLFASGITILVQTSEYNKFINSFNETKEKYEYICEATDNEEMRAVSFLVLDCQKFNKTLENYRDYYEKFQYFAIIPQSVTSIEPIGGQ